MKKINELLESAYEKLNKEIVSEDVPAVNTSNSTQQPSIQQEPLYSGLFTRYIASKDVTPQDIQGILKMLDGNKINDARKAMESKLQVSNQQQAKQAGSNIQQTIQQPKI